MNEIDDLVTRLANYIAALPPHARERQGGKLLREAADEIERLRDLARCDSVREDATCRAQP